MKIIISFSIVLAFFLLYFLLSSDFPPEEIHENVSHIENIQLKHTSNGVTEWTARISSALLDPETNYATLEKVQFNFQTQRVRIYADSGKYNLMTDDLELDGSVQASTDDIIVNLDSISWSPSQKELSSQSDVSIEGGSYSVRGQGLLITEDGEIRIEKNAHAIITF